MITRIIENLDKDQAESIMDSIYRNDSGSSFGGNWHHGRHVYGAVITAQYDPRKRSLKIHAGALSTNMGLNEYLPREYHI